MSVYDVCRISFKDKVGLFTILSIVFPPFMLYTLIKFAKAFGKGIGYGIFLFLTGGIAYLFLFFDDPKYLGPQ